MNFLMIWIEAKRCDAEKKTSRGEKLFFYPIFFEAEDFLLETNF